MSRKLTQDELQKVIAEVTRLVEKKEENLDRQEVVKILDELNLPSDLLDEAMTEISRREIKQRAQRKNVAIAIAVTAIIATACFLFFSTASMKNAEMAKIEATSTRITGAVDDGSDAATVHTDGKEVFLRITLQNVPLNERLSVRTDWIEPGGKTYKQNRWQTKPTTSTVWETHSKAVIGDAAPRGDWLVRVFLGDRLLIEKKFKVE